MNSATFFCQRFFRIGLILGTIGGFPNLLFAQEANQAKLKANWDQGITLSAPGKPLLFRFGGRIHADWAFISPSSELKDKVGNTGNFTTQFTRIRLYQSGQIGPNFSYKLQLDFDDGFASLKDVYITLKQIPIAGNIRLGHQKEFFSIESMTSSNHTVFMNRSLGDRFMPRRNTGVTFFNNYINGRLTWGAGLYIPSDETGSPRNSNADNYNLSGRLNGVPYRKDSAHQLIISGAFSYRSRKQEQFAGTPESSIPETYLGPYILSDIAHNTVTNYTASFVHGALNIQAAYRASKPEPSPKNNSMEGYYGQISYFLTGEHRNYNSASGDFKTVIPYQNFNLSKEGGSGALEIAFRGSYLNLKHPLTQGGQMTGYTIALNWYLNPNSRIMVNYLHTKVGNSGKANIVQSRFQVAF